MLRFRDLGVFVFEFWVLRFRSRVLRFRLLGASFWRFGCFVLRSSFSSASFSKLPHFTHGPQSAFYTDRKRNSEKFKLEIFEFRFESLKSISVLILFVYTLMIRSSKSNRKN